MIRFTRIPARALAVTLGLALTATSAWPQSGQHQGRNFDAREKANVGFEQAPDASQRQAEQALRQDIPGLLVAYEKSNGAARSLVNPTGYLSDADAKNTPRGVAEGFVNKHRDLLGLTATDTGSHEVTDEVFSRVTGATHVYLRQTHGGIPVYNGQLQVTVNRDGRVLGAANGFARDLARSINANRPSIDAAQAVAAAAEHLGVALATAPEVLSTDPGRQQTTRLHQGDLSREEIVARLMWLPIRIGDTRLVWNFNVATTDDEHMYDFTVDAVSGQVWTRFDWANSAQYRVYPQPVESPNHTSPAPPSDARQLLVDPADPTASPLGWHDTGSTSYTILRGNNVHAYEDSDANNSPPTSQPSCGSSLNCDFSLNLSQSPSTYRPAAVANLFYWNNVIHDIQYQYGFDEAAGNFQVNNFGNGGAGNDDVRAEAQDGSGTCNANFATPADGSRPRMQMYVCGNHDGDLDSGVVVHEYGHGISTRQVGGPSNPNCLDNNQQPGEGWSDFFALVYTAEAGDQGTDARGMGTYLIGEPANGPGIRTQPYSTDPAVNDHDYEAIQGMAIPHGVGEVWAEVVWKMYWALVDQYGFDPDLYHPSGAGNHRALLYVNEGLKSTACSPTFVDARNGIIQAATDNFGGADVCTIWQVFADYGIGTDAVSGGSNSTNPTNGYGVPASCQCSPNPVADAGPDQSICLGDSATIGTPAQSGHSYSWSPGGQTAAEILVAPTTTTTYTVTASTSCGSAQDSVTVQVDDGSGGAGFDDDLEGSTSGWSTSGLWHLANNSSCASPGYSSATHAFYYGQDSTCNYSTGGSTTGTLTSPSISGITASSALSFDYLRVVESYSGGSYDQTDVEIVTSGGSTTIWSRDSTDASSSSWQSSGSISLAAFAGQTIQVRFRFNSVDGVSNTFTGWLVDDVVVTGESGCSPPANTAPSVTITSPANGTTVTQGTSVGFAGTATDAEDGSLTSSLAWSSNLDGAIGSGGSFSASSLSVGTHTVTASVTDSGGLPGSDSISVTITSAGGGCSDCVDWSTTPTVSYSNQDVSANVTIEDGGDTILLRNNTWRRTTQTFAVTANTVLEFDFRSTVQGEIHGIGFDENDTLADAVRIFQVHGTQNWTDGNHDYDNYDGSGNWTTYTIPVGSYYTGAAMYLVVANDNDAGSGNDSRFRNVRIYEDVPVGCSLDDNFDSGASGWVNAAGSTCTTGAFVLATPTQVVDTGVTTQVGGDHTSGSGNAIFTATNSSAGVDDVDGGVCILESPVWSVTEASDLSVWYFHGQRDAGDDPAGDYFVLEVSTNAGTSYSPVVSIGDVTRNAAWTQATTPVAAGSSVKLRVRISDGTANGDLVEGGIDDLRICPSN